MLADSKTMNVIMLTRPQNDSVRAAEVVEVRARFIGQDH